MITQSEKYIVRVNSSVLKNPKYRAYLTLRGNSINSSYKSGATTDRSRAQKYHSVESAAKAVKHLLLTAKAQSDEYREDLLKGARIYSYSTDEIIGYVVDIIEDLENRKENEMKGKGQMSNARDFENDPNPMGRVLKIWKTISHSLTVLVSKTTGYYCESRDLPSLVLMVRLLKLMGPCFYSIAGMIYMHSANRS